MKTNRHFGFKLI